MSYQGGKTFLAPILAPIVRRVAGVRRVVEPFHGSLAMTAALQPPIAGDLSRPMTALVGAMRRGWRPPAALSESEYQELSDRRADLDDPLVAFAGHFASFGGKWFAGYARPHAKERDRVGRVRAMLIERVEATAWADLIRCPYHEFPVEPGDVVYCDPPYAGTSCDYPVDAFDHVAFWSWARQQRDRDVVVIVSEFTAPADVPVLWQSERPALTRYADGRRPIERLFMLTPRDL